MITALYLDFHVNMKLLRCGCANCEGFFLSFMQLSFLYIFSLMLRIKISLAIFLSVYDLRLKFFINHYPQLLPFLSLYLGIHDITVIMINIICI